MLTDVRSVFSVTSAASDRSLLTIAELRAAVGVTDSSLDAALMTLGARVEQIISRACGLAADGTNPPTLLRETCRDAFRLRKTLRAPLRLSRRPVTSITSVTIDDETLDTDEFEVNPATGLLVRLCDDREIEWPCGTVTAGYVAGYATVPDDLKEAASKLTAALYTTTGENTNLRRVDIPGVEEREYWVPPSDDPLVTREINELLAPFIQRW
jgi:hypothetical protein